MSPIDASVDEGEKPQEVTGEIEFRGVEFAYPSREDVMVINRIWKCFKKFEKMILKRFWKI